MELSRCTTLSVEWESYLIHDPYRVPPPSVGAKCPSVLPEGLGAGSAVRGTYQTSRRMMSGPGARASYPSQQPVTQPSGRYASKAASLIRVLPTARGFSLSDVAEPQEKSRVGSGSHARHRAMATMWRMCGPLISVLRTVAPTRFIILGAQNGHAIDLYGQRIHQRPG